MSVPVAPTAAAHGRPLEDADVIATGARWSRRVVVGAVASSLVALALPAAAYDVAVLVAVGAGLLAGLPHGSIDHRLAASLTGRPAPVVAVSYAAVAMLTWVLLALAGPAVGSVALAAVLVLSVTHFGLGELEVIAESTGWRPRGLVAVAVAVAGTGALLLPLARAGEQLGDVATAVSPVLGTLLADPGMRWALAGGWVLAASVAVVAALRAGRRAVALDVALVGVLGAVAPPLVAFAVWFGGWHSLRHCARLLTVEPGSAALLRQGRSAAAVRLLVRGALLPSLAAVAVLAGLVSLTVAAADPVAALAQTLLVLLALTVPHMVVVLWLDRRVGA